ncbi:unnamed protein product [Sphagnum troendelagicum]|uniref:Uncharacterized protein n=1 Tax=Sphagnum troendelagicum TaxID=128251 RepID=A0ABP0UA36_9BRYO
MSLKDLKESLKSCSTRILTCSSSGSSSSAAPTVPIEPGSGSVLAVGSGASVSQEVDNRRLPPKTNLRDQLAFSFQSFEGISEVLQRKNGAVEARQIGEQRHERRGMQLGSDDEEEEDEEIGGGEEDVKRDSEAGLFIRAESKGLYEPLVLWPPPDRAADGGDEVVQVPASINSRLLEHQREGVRFLYKLYRENRGGILGDDMGLGKTIQSIALLAALLQMDGDLDCLARGGHVISGSSIVSKTRGSGVENYVGSSSKVFLIVCPTSVLRNWEQEFQAWGSFRVGIYHGAQRETVMAKAEAGDLEVVLTSHDMFRLYGMLLSSIKWDCVIVDEAHRLKNEKSKLYQACSKISTKRRFGLTGTIMQNKYIELFNVFEWAAPGSLGPREFFREYYDEPIKQGQRISAPDRFVKIAAERKEHLVKLISQHLLRRTKGETIGHLMLGKEDNVVFCKMSDVQHRVYRRLLQSPDFQLLVNKDLPCSCGSHLSRVECCHRIAPDGVIWSYLHSDNPDGCDHCPFCLVLPCLVKLQQVSNHLELVKPNPKDDREKQLKDEEFATAALAEDALLLGGVKQDESFLGLSDAQHCGKMQTLEILLADWLRQGDKVLLFSYSVKMLDILDRFMIRKGYCFCRLDGSTPMGLRQSLVDEFNHSPSKQVFLISTRAGGLGLNLVSANRVVIFDPNWNPAQDLQAQDRSFRFGQQRHVTVFRLLAAGSIEELIYSRQIYKQQLFNIGVNGNIEKRYFEGVQDSKDYKGELFGISNLFRDLSDFTSDIIGKHDERLISIQQTTTVLNNSNSHLQVKTEPAQRVGNEDNCGMHDIVEVDTIRSNGVVYSHRNEEVVNMGAPSSKASKPDGSEIIEPTHREESLEIKPLAAVGNGSSASKKDGGPQVTVVIDSQPLEYDSTNDSQQTSGVLAAVVDDGGTDSRSQQKLRQSQELAMFEGMDETTKWLMEISGFIPSI